MLLNNIIFLYKTDILSIRKHMVKIIFNILHWNFCFIIFVALFQIYRFGRQWGLELEAGWPSMFRKWSISFSEFDAIVQRLIPNLLSSFWQSFFIFIFTIDKFSGIMWNFCVHFKIVYIRKLRQELLINFPAVIVNLKASVVSYSSFAHLNRFFEFWWTLWTISLNVAVWTLRKRKQLKG